MGPVFVWLSDWHKITEIESVFAQNNLTGCVRYRPPEQGAVINERVEFSVLTTGIDSIRQRRKELLIIGFADECSVKQV
jgi:hypothetical protein